MRVLITGSRSWTDRDTIKRCLSRYHDATVVSGACPKGADRLAEDVARDLGHTVERHPADWSRHGRAAGFRRNEAMVRLGADVVLAFWDGESRGTYHTITTARAAGLPVQVIRPGGAR